MTSKPPSLRALLALLILVVTAAPSRAGTIFQAANSQSVAWEAEETLSITNASPTTWIATNDATANGGRALYQAGANQTTSPASYAVYAIKFRAAGTYSLYLRWRADKAFTDLDPNAGNSYFPPLDFGDLAPLAANFPTASSANNSRVPPAVNTYAMTREATTFNVTQAQVDAGAPLTFKVGTREAGMYIDRFAFSQNAAMTEAEFNALDNSETDIVPQGAGETFVAFEAERISRIVNGAPTLWFATNDATASGSQALYQAGANQTTTPSSYALYAIKFRAAGTYSLYHRWRADKAFTDLDPNAGNSYFPPLDFGDLAGTTANFPTASSANNSRVPPAVNTYAMTREATTYTVTQAQVDAGAPLTFKVGTREAGMYIDRFVFSQNAALTEAEFNALQNSGSVARPGILKAVGSASLTTVTVSFDRPLSPTSVVASRFTLSGGVNVTAAVLDPNTSKDVLLTTSAQTQGSNYVVTVNGVTDVSNNAVSANSKVSFTAWKLANGWITRELFYAVTGNTVGDLQAAQKFIDNTPDAVDFVRSVSVGSDLQVANYGARYRGYFTPAQTAAYEFYIYADNDALFAFSTDESPINLFPYLPSTTGLVNFDAATVFPSPTLTAGKRYLFEVLFKQGGGAASVGVAARRVGTTGPVDQLPVLSGALVSTFVNPDIGGVTFKQQPASVTIPAGTRAKLSVSATAVSPGTVFYQWQVNGVDIPSATRPTYVTPVLSAADNGKQYRCVVSVNGSDVPSSAATITVGPAQPSPLQPYVGINFVGGGDQGTTAGAALATNDVAGAVLQEYFNNVVGRTTINGIQALVDAQGASAPVTVAVIDPATGTPVAAADSIGNGAGNVSADHVMLQGYISNNNLPITLQLGGVPPGNYAVIVYSVGFNFNSTYEEDFALVGAATYPVYTVRGQTATEFIASPVLVRMTSTNPANRDRGNYVMFDNVSPSTSGTLTLTATPQSSTVGNTGYFPPINAIQLVKVVAVAVPTTLSASRQGSNIVLSWPASASGYVLESSSAVGPSAAWSVVQNTPNPISAAGTTSVTVAPSARFFRLRK